jgi:hypothetical protein
MKLFAIATVVAMIALLPEYSFAMAQNHGGRGVGAGAGATAQNAGPDANTPVSVPEPGSLLLVTTGLSAVGGLLVRKWYVTKKQAKRLERPEL